MAQARPDIWAQRAEAERLDTAVKLVAVKLGGTVIEDRNWTLQEEVEYRLRAAGLTGRDTEKVTEWNDGARQRAGRAAA